MKKSILFLALVSVLGTTIAQKKKTTTSATISFDATTKLDALPKGDNKTVVASLDTKSGAVAFESVVKSFSFSNPKMQEHFNSPMWMDSDKFPKATFKGKITNVADVKFTTDGTYSATVTGDLTIHGVTKPVSTTASVVVSGKTVTTTSNFVIALADYGVNGAAIGAGKVSTDPKITVVAEFK
ncbi:YceI family protein [Ferruginibacter sp. SUN106]|uniref:YceI family protein n=1 Tax=Ferruginibacter sp. SUN106 TaxID=2978348 RepID=UPI003D35B2EE